MSYILDALKKAERERGIAKVPTLETIHATAAKPENIRWTVIFIVLILAAAATGLYMFMGRGSGRVDPDSPDYGSQTLIADQADEDDSDAGSRPDQARFQERSAASQAIPGATTSERPQESPDSSGTPNRRGRTISSRQTGSASGAAAEEEPFNEAPYEETSESIAENPRLIREAVEPAANNSPRPPPLREAVQEMRVTIHLYSSVAENRKIFINGRKYAEGDYVDGAYLIESITPEGAVLSYEGTRAEIRAAD